MALFLKTDESNWNRACRLLIEAGKEVLMLYLDDFWSRDGHASLDGFLAAKRLTLDRLAAKEILHQTQMDILYPASGYTDTAQWDITLVSCVINKCIPNKTVLEKAAINTIRELRNKLYGHDGKMKMNDKEYTQNWAEIKQGLTVAAIDLSVSQHFSLQTRMDRIEKEQIVDGKELRNTIQEWKSCDIVLSEGIQLLGEGQKEQKTMMTEIRRDNTEIKTLLEERTSLDKDMKTMLTEERHDTTEMKTLLEERTSHDRDMKTMMTEERRDATEMKTLLEERTSHDRDMKTMMTEERRDATEMKILLEERTIHDKDMKTMMTEERHDTTGMKTLLEERTRHDRDIKTMMTEERHDTTEMKTLLEERTSHDRDMKTMMTEERCDTSGIKTLLEQRTSHDSDMKTMLAEERRDISEMKILLEERTNEMRTEFKDLKTMITDDKPRPAERSGLEDLGKDPQSSGEEVTHCPKNLVGPAVQQECTASRLEADTGATLPEKFRALQSGLMEYYKSLFTLPTGVGSLSDQTDIDEIYAEPRLVLVDHTAGTQEKAKKTEKNISLEDVFLETTSGCRQIYVSADAGKGKTSLCKRILKDWCSVHSQGQLTGGPGQVSTLKQFHFLFYVSLRHAETQYDINEMIVSQLLYKNPHIKQAKFVNDNAGDLLDVVMEEYSERCLILLDGLDEWKAPKNSKYPSVSNGVPGRNPHLKYTMLTTTRPWKLEILRLKSTEIHRQIELRGVKDTDEFERKLVLAYNKEENKQKMYTEFDSLLHRTRLFKMKETPILLKQLICLWHNDQPFGNSKTEVYTKMVELLIKLAEKREDVKEFKLQRDNSDMKAVATPKCFENLEKCKSYKCLLLTIGRLAFETLFCSEKETQLVFESSKAKTNGLDESDVHLSLTVGILTQSIIPDKTCERKSISFLHKTFHEYFAALYLSVFGNKLNDLKTRIGSRCNSLSNLFDMEDFFLFLSGMCPSLMKYLSSCLLTAIDNDTRLKEARQTLHLVRWDIYIRLFQLMILACCKESCDNGLGPLYLPVPDVYIGESVMGLSQEQYQTLWLCVQEYSSQIRSVVWNPSSDNVYKMQEMFGSVRFASILYKSKCRNMSIEKALLGYLNLLH